MSPSSVTASLGYRAPLVPYALRLSPITAMRMESGAGVMATPVTDTTMESL